LILLSLKRYGITTGAAAAAAAKAATYDLLYDLRSSTVTIPTPIGLRLEIEVAAYSQRADERCATVNKVAGDNPDVLDGVEIRSCCARIQGNDVVVVGGEGVGKVTRPGLKTSVGESAISPIARDMIVQSVREVLKDGGIRVTVEVPKGSILAKDTMNPDVGVEGGVSILGTTGIEVPVSDEDYMDHLRTELCVIKLSGDMLVVAPGNTSAEVGRRLYGDVVVKVGDRVGDTIIEALRKGFKRIVLVSLPGKLVKVAAGLMNTHSRYGDCRVETITHASVLAGVDEELLTKIASSKTVGEALSLLGQRKEEVMSIVAQRALFRLMSLGRASFGVVACDESGRVIARAGEI